MKDPFSLSSSHSLFENVVDVMQLFTVEVNNEFLQFIVILKEAKTIDVEDDQRANLFGIFVFEFILRVEFIRVEIEQTCFGLFHFLERTDGR
jgi:hypothetical protein